MVNALVAKAEEGRGRRRNARGSCLQAMIPRCPNEETPVCESRLKLGDTKYLCFFLKLFLSKKTCGKFFEKMFLRKGHKRLVLLSWVSRGTETSKYPEEKKSKRFR